MPVAAVALQQHVAKTASCMNGPASGGRLLHTAPTNNVVRHKTAERGWCTKMAFHWGAVFAHHPHRQTAPTQGLLAGAVAINRPPIRLRFSFLPPPSQTSDVAKKSRRRFFAVFGLRGPSTGPRTSRPLPQDRFFVLSRFLTLPGPAEGPQMPKTGKNLRLDFFKTLEVWD